MDKTIEDVYRAAKNRICKEIDGVCDADRLAALTGLITAIAEHRNLT